MIGRFPESIGHGQEVKKMRQIIIALIILTTFFQFSSSPISAQRVAPRTRPFATPNSNSTSSTTKTRREFAEVMAKVKEGMAEKDARAIVGEPDYIQTDSDPGGVPHGLGTKEIWRFGGHGQLTFPTLGRVYIDNARKVQYVFGGEGRPPAEGVFNEDELRNLLSLIDKTPHYGSANSFNPGVFIAIANKLQSIGKQRALMAIDEYLRVSEGDATARDGIYLIMRAIFELPADTGIMPDMSLDSPVPTPIESQMKKMPRYPIYLLGDVPLNLCSGHGLRASPDQPLRSIKQVEPLNQHLDWYRKKGKLRSTPLFPTDNPIDIIDQWEILSDGLYDKSTQPEMRFVVANQVVRMIDPVYRRGDLDGRERIIENDLDWKKVKDEISALKVRWDSEKCHYVFRDGSHLPPLLKKMYPRKFWKIDDLDGTADVVIERLNEKRVRFELRWTGKIDQLPTIEFDALEVGETRNRLDSTDNQTVLYPGRDGMRRCCSSFEIVRHERKEIVLRLTVNNGKELRSPAIEP